MITIKQALDMAVKAHSKGRLDEAENIYKKILEKDQNSDNAMHLLGLIAYQKGKNKEAIELISKAIKLNPNAIYYSNLGIVYDSLKENESSAECFNKALKLDPNHKDAYKSHYNLGVFFMDKGKIKEALKHYNKAIKLNKKFFDVRWNKSLILLLLGKFKEGWSEYKYRFKKENPSDSRIFNKPEWDGSSLNGKKILIVSEQGFGDNIQFIRYIPLVKEKNGYIILECKKELKKLFENSPEINKNVDEIIEKTEKTPDKDFDFYIHIMSLPQIFNTDLNSIPNKIPYLKADMFLVEKFKQKIDQISKPVLNNKNKIKVGIAWAGNPNQENDKNRSITFEKFKTLKQPGITLFSLQKGEAAKQLDDLKIIDLTDEINDFADAAAIIQNLDLVISVDTSVAHLAGALGKSIWTLLTLTPDWRWLLDRKDSPWYPTMKLFRQKKLGDWNSLINEVAEELKTFSKTL